MSLNLHANAVAWNKEAVLLLGPSGSGKSSLSLALIALGAQLVSDDRTLLERKGDRIFAQSPAPLTGLIEARGFGILRLPALGPTPVRAVIDLSCESQERLPQRQNYSCLGLELPFFHNCASSYFPSVIIAYLKGELADL